MLKIYLFDQIFKLVLELNSLAQLRLMFKTFDILILQMVQ